MITQARLNAMRDALHDARALLEVIHIRETTGRGPSYSAIRGQVAATLVQITQALEAPDDAQ